MTTSTDRYRELIAISNTPDHDNDIYIAMRSLLIDPHDAEPMPDLTDPIALALIPLIRDHILALHEHAALPHDESARHALSMLALDFTLCPMHFIDYAICFDDETAECATIRTYFPSHDT